MFCSGAFESDDIPQLVFSTCIEFHEIASPDILGEGPQHVSRHFDRSEISLQKFLQDFKNKIFFSTRKVPYPKVPAHTKKLGLDL